jgi:hypothetical protein
MRNYIFISVFFAFFQGAIFGQTKIGFHLGANYNNTTILTTPAGITPKDLYKPVLGLVLGVNTVFFSDKKISLISKLDYQSFGAKYPLNDKPDVEKALNLSIAPAFKLSKHFIPQVGLFASLPIKKSIQGSNSFNMGWQAGFSIPNDRYSISVGYYQPFKVFATEPGGLNVIRNYYRQGVQISFGYYFLEK